MIVIDSQNFKMDRRNFLRSSSVALAAVTLESKRIAGLPPLTLMPAAGRLTLPMNRNWRFSAARLAKDTARADATRVVLKVADEFGNLLRYATAAIAFTIEGPAEIIGDNPFSLMGGCGAVWVGAGQQPGLLRLKAMHAALGTREVEIKIVAAEPERV